jgi:hypothetical protein
VRVGVGGNIRENIFMFSLIFDMRVAVGGNIKENINMFSPILPPNPPWGDEKY